MSYDIKKTAELLGRTQQRIRQMCAAGELAGAVKEGSRWQIPADAAPKLFEDSINKQNSGIDELRDVAENKKNDALRRFGAIKKFDKFSATFPDKKRTEAIKAFCKESNLKWRSFYRMLRRYREQGLIGLIDTRGGGKFLNEIISPDAFEIFKSMYLTEQRLSLKICWQNILFLNKDQKKGWKIPSLQCLYQYVTRYIPEYARILHREGIDAYNAKCAPYIEIDPDSIAPGQVWVGDHHQLNCWIRHRNRWVRPWLTAWQDQRSRAILGCYISSSPNQTTILLAFKRAVERYGPPDSVRIDNGRDFDSEVWTGITKLKRRAIRKGYLDEPLIAGIYAMMDISVHFTIKYHAQSKIIERFFDTLDCQFTKTIATYCGKDSERKPEYLKNLLSSEQAIREAFTIEQLNAVLDRYLEAYNNTAHSGNGMADMSPVNLFNTRNSRRALAEGVTELLLRVWSGELVVGKNGIRFKGLWYGQYDMTLMTYQGKKVRAAYNPDDMRKVYVYDANTLRLIVIAEQARLVQFGSSVGEEALRFAMAQKSHALKIAKQFRDSRLTANMDLTSLTIRAMQDAAEEPAEEQPGTLRPVRTPFDNQVAEHNRQENLREVRKAVGAENITKVLDIDIEPEGKNKYSDMKIFDD
jgi:hypothetical protein